MFNEFNKLFGRKPVQKRGPLMQEAPSTLPQRDNQQRSPTFTKVFRWRLPDGQTREPSTVEIVGSFTHWQKVPMQRDGVLDAWHATIHHVPGHRTHHYMFLVDGQPAH